MGRGTGDQGPTVSESFEDFGPALKNLVLIYLFCFEEFDGSYFDGSYSCIHHRR